MPHFFHYGDLKRAYNSDGNVPRQIVARRLEAEDVRSVSARAYLRGGHSADDGDTIHDVERFSLRMGFDSIQGDLPLVSARATVVFPQEGLTRDPKPGDPLSVDIAVDTNNRLAIFRGDVENVKAGADGRTWELSCFDGLRRLQEMPFNSPSALSAVTGVYRDDADETTLLDEVQDQIDMLLSHASVFTYSRIGINQYPSVANDRHSVWDEISDLLRAAQCRAYMGPHGRLHVNYTDSAPLWAPVMQTDLSHAQDLGFLPGWDTGGQDFAPYRQVNCIFPDRFMQQRTGSGASPKYPGPNDTPAAGHTLWHVPMFQFNPDNAKSIRAIESSLIVNEVRSRTTPEASLRDFIDLSALSFEEYETLTFSQLGEGSTSDAVGTASAMEYGLRSRVWSLGGLAEVPRSSVENAAGWTDTNVGRYALDRKSFSESQVLARQFPRQRVHITSPGILSLFPFEVVALNFPDEGFVGFYMIEGRRYSLGTSGFTTEDLLVSMEMPQEFITLDARDQVRQA